MVYSSFNIRYRAASGIEELSLGTSVSPKNIEVLEEIGAGN